MMRHAGGLTAVAFWCGVPLAVAAVLLWPSGSVVHVGSDPFSIEINPSTSWLPWPLGEVEYHYPASLLALGVLVASVKLGRWRPAQASVWLPTFFLPTYVAGIESTQLVAWSMRCHSVTNPPPFTDVVASGALLSGSVLVATVLMGAWAARSYGYGLLAWRPVPAGVFAVLGSVAMLWRVLWTLATPL